MPRACLPNARFLASADSPLLPFLAPRVFAEAPFPRRRERQDGRRTQEEQEVENGKRNIYAKDIPALKSRRSGLKEVSTYTRAASNTINGERKSMLTTSCTVARPAAAQSQGSSSTLGSRYADIFSIARQQMRSYSTQDTDRTTQTATPRDHRSARRRRSPRSVIHSASDTHVLHGHIRKVENGPAAEVHPGSGTLKNRRSKRMLHTVQTRMVLLLNSIRTRDKDVLMKLGRYRSLRRRLFNFARESSKSIDLRESSGLLSQPDGLIQATAALDRLAYPGIKRRTAELKLRHDNRCPSWAVSLLNNVGIRGEEQMWSNWMEFPDEIRKTGWPYLLFYLLHRMPYRCLSFIRILTDHPHANSKPEILADALEHLARVFIRDASESNGRNTYLVRARSLFVPTFYHTFRDQLASHPHICSQDLLLNVARLANVGDLGRIFDLFSEKNTHLIYDTYLHYANTFAAAGDHQYALRCLKAIPERTSDPKAKQALVNRERFRWTCAFILRKSTSDGQQYHETTGIVAAFVELGVKLDILLYNVIMSNAMEAGDYATAFRVYNTLEENGLNPNARTFAILLYGCTTASDPGKFDDFAEYCGRKAKELKDPWLATDYLYYLYVRYHKDGKDVQQEFSRFSETYSELFTNAPLEPLGRQTRAQASNTAGQEDGASRSLQMVPTPAALYIMLQLEVQSAVATSTRRIRRLYDHFKHLVRAKHHPVLTELAKDPVIWNAFLLAFCRIQQYASASALITDMTDMGVQPNVYSWNIFMQAFFKTNQVKAAERVQEIMRSRGVEPDQFTHGVLLRGYARAQHVKKIGETMEHVENEQQLDPQLLQALARVQKRRWLMYTLEKSRLKKEQTEKERAEQKVEIEKKRWRAPFFSLLASKSDDAADAPANPQPNIEPSFGSELGFKSIITQDYVSSMERDRHCLRVRKLFTKKPAKRSPSQRKSGVRHARVSRNPPRNS